MAITCVPRLVFSQGGVAITDIWVYYARFTLSTYETNNSIRVDDQRHTQSGLSIINAAALVHLLFPRKPRDVLRQMLTAPSLRRQLQLTGSFALSYRTVVMVYYYAGWQHGTQIINRLLCSNGRPSVL